MYDRLKDKAYFAISLQWRHNERDSVSNHQPHDCLLNRLFGRRSKKTSKLRVTGLCVGTSPGPLNSPHKGPVTRKMFPFDDVIMIRALTSWLHDSSCSKIKAILKMAMLYFKRFFFATHRGSLTHVYVSGLDIIGLGNGLSPSQRLSKICA